MPDKDAPRMVPPTGARLQWEEIAAEDEAGRPPDAADCPSGTCSRAAKLAAWLRENSSGAYRPAREAADLLEEMAGRFTKLDQPKGTGAKMLDDVLSVPNPEFRAWVASLPATYWARYDLSAARIGWEAARSFYSGSDQGHGRHTAAPNESDDGTPS